MPKKKNFKKFKLSSTIPVITPKKTTKITVIDYDEKKFQEKEPKAIEECFQFKETPTVSWINVEGVYQTETIKKLDDYFGLHPLIIEDIKNFNQRPRVEDFGDYIYIVAKMLSYDGKSEALNSEQISIILAKNFVITFQEGRVGDVFEQVRWKIRNNKGKIRKMSSDYLIYSLIDSIVDNYFQILEELGEKVELLGERIVSSPGREALRSMSDLKRNVITLRKSVWPLREVIDTLERGESTLIKKTTHVYLRDVYYHTIQIIDNIETTRDILSEMLGVYLSSISNRTNEIMKFLTIIATIFMPLTFVVGLYGMNFKFMPELSWRFGYPLALAIIILTASLMLIFFKKKKWL